MGEIVVPYWEASDKLCHCDAHVDGDVQERLNLFFRELSDHDNDLPLMIGKLPITTAISLNEWAIGNNSAALNVSVRRELRLTAFDEDSDDAVTMSPALLRFDQDELRHPNPDTDMILSDLIWPHAVRNLRALDGFQGEYQSMVVHEYPIPSRPMDHILELEVRDLIDWGNQAVARIAMSPWPHDPQVLNMDRRIGHVNELQRLAVARLGWADNAPIMKFSPEAIEAVGEKDSYSPDDADSAAKLAIIASRMMLYAAMRTRAGVCGVDEAIDYWSMCAIHDALSRQPKKQLDEQSRQEVLTNLVVAATMDGFILENVEDCGIKRVLPRRFQQFNWNKMRNRPHELRRERLWPMTEGINRLIPGWVWVAWALAEGTKFEKAFEKDLERVNYGSYDLQKRTLNYLLGA